MEVPVTWLDLVVLGVLLVFGIGAAWGGFVQKLLGDASWIAAAFATLAFSPMFRPVARDRIEPEILADIVTYGVIFLAVLLPLSFLSHNISKGVGRSAAGTLDHALGFFYGVARGLALLAIGYIVFSEVSGRDNQPQWLAEARTLPLIESAESVILSVIPRQDGELRGAERTRPAAEPRQRAATPPAPRETAPAAPDEAGGPGYGESERDALDQLVRSTTGEEPADGAEDDNDEGQ